jgi:hypothetical protein
MSVSSAIQLIGGTFKLKYDGLKKRTHSLWGHKSDSFNCLDVRVIQHINVPPINCIADDTDIALQNPNHLVAHRSTCYSMPHPSFKNIIG